MQYLKKHFSIITLRELALYISEQRLIPENSCVVTFDDNFKDHYDYAFPILFQDYQQINQNVGKVHYFVGNFH